MTTYLRFEVTLHNKLLTTLIEYIANLLEYNDLARHSQHLRGPFALPALDLHTLNDVVICQMMYKRFSNLLTHCLHFLH